jgi:hypothetical protein
MRWGPPSAADPGRSGQEMRRNSAKPSALAHSGCGYPEIGEAKAVVQTLLNADEPEKRLYSKPRPSLLKPMIFWCTSVEVRIRKVR